MRVRIAIVSPSMSTGVPPRRRPGATSTTVTRYPSWFSQNAVAKPAKLAPLTSAACVSVEDAPDITVDAGMPPPQNDLDMKIY